MVRRSPRYAALYATADTQLGLVTSTQICELGIAYSTISRNVAGGLWTKVLPGIHLVHGGRPLPVQCEKAALLYAGPEALLTGISALRHWDIRAFGLQSAALDLDHIEPVHALIPHGVRRKSAGFARIERTRRFPDETVVRHGLALAPLPRAVADACRRMHRERDVLELVTEVLQRGMCTHDELTRELDEGQRRGSAFLRAALNGTATGAASPPEVDLRALLATVGIDAQLNGTLVDRFGNAVAVPDAWIEEAGLAIEVDSEAHHGSAAGHERTIRRNARYAAAGVPFLTLLPVDIARRPGQVLSWVDAACAEARARPRAAVRLVADRPRTAQRREWRWGA